MRPARSFHCALVAGLGFLIASGAYLRAQTAPASAKAPATNAPSAKAPAAVTTKTAPAKTPPPAPLPPGLQNTLSRYGNIVQPGDQVTYPLKLHLPFPNEGEVRLPKQDDLAKRQKLEALARLSDDDIRKQLAAWPAYNKMSLRDQALMLQRIQDFRDYHTRVAVQKAHDMGLLTLNAQQMTKFESEYWNKRLKMDQDLARQFQPIYVAREQKMEDELFREFSADASIPAPPKPNPPGKKSPQAMAKPVAAATNPPSPVAQAQH